MMEFVEFDWFWLALAVVFIACFLLGRHYR